MSRARPTTVECEACDGEGRIAVGQDPVTYSGSGDSPRFRDVYEACEACGGEGRVPAPPRPGPFIVSFYRHDRAYGGPEEGGWYYDCGVLLRVSRVFKDAERASAYCRRANVKLDRWQDRAGVPPIYSVVSEGRIVAMVWERVPAEYYPQEVPRYE